MAKYRVTGKQPIVLCSGEGPRERQIEPTGEFDAAEHPGLDQAQIDFWLKTGAITELKEQA